MSSHAGTTKKLRDEPRHFGPWEAPSSRGHFNESNPTSRACVRMLRRERGPALGSPSVPAGDGALDPGRHANRSRPDHLDSCPDRLIGPTSSGIACRKGQALATRGSADQAVVHSPAGDATIGQLPMDLAE